MLQIIPFIAIIAKNTYIAIEVKIFSNPCKMHFISKLMNHDVYIKEHINHLFTDNFHPRLNGDVFLLAGLIYLSENFQMQNDLKILLKNFKKVILQFFAAKKQKWNQELYFPCGKLINLILPTTLIQLMHN